MMSSVELANWKQSRCHFHLEQNVKERFVQWAIKKRYVNLKREICNGLKTGHIYNKKRRNYHTTDSFVNNQHLN